MSIHDPFRGYIINVHGYISKPNSIGGGAFLNRFHSGSQFLSYCQVNLEAGAGAVLVDRIEFIDIRKIQSPSPEEDPLTHEIIDLFSQNSGDYEPTEAEKAAINEGVDRILKLARAGITEV